MFLYAIRMSKKYTWEENNKRYVEFKATMEVKGHAERGFEYHPLVRRYSLDNVLLVIVSFIYSQHGLSFKIYVLYIIH